MAIYLPFECPLMAESCDWATTDAWLKRSQGEALRRPPHLLSNAADPEMRPFWRAFWVDAGLTWLNDGRSFSRSARCLAQTIDG